jgi:hypothetical protein
MATFATSQNPLKNTSVNYLSFGGNPSFVGGLGFGGVGN